MDVVRYTHNSKGLREIFTYSISINKGRTTTPKSAHTNLLVNSLLCSFSLSVKIFEEDIQSSKDHVDTAIRGIE